MTNAIEQLRTNPIFLAYFLLTVMSNGVTINQIGNTWRLSFKNTLAGLDSSATYKSPLDAINRVVDVVYDGFTAVEKGTVAA